MPVAIAETPRNRSRYPSGSRHTCMISWPFAVFEQRMSGRDALLHEIDLDPVRNYAGFVAAVEEELHGLAAARAVIERVVVDVHADESVRLRASEVAGVLHGVCESRVAVVEGVADARAD